MTPRARVVTTVLVIAVVTLGTLVAVSVAVRGNPPGPSALPTSHPSPTPTPDTGLAITVYQDDTLADGQPIDPPGRSIQSRLWSIDDRWFAAMVEPTSRETRIYALSADGSTWADTGVLIDERPGAMADVLWADDHLYVASAVPGRSTRNGVRLSRFSPSTDRPFRLDPNFPVRLTERGVPAASLTRDPTGRLWVAFTTDGVITTAHSLSDDAIWDTPRAFADGDPIAPTDIVGVATNGRGVVDLVWAAGDGSAVWFAEHADSAPPDTWSAPETIVSEVPVVSDSLSLASDLDGTLAVTIEAGQDDAVNPSIGDPGTIFGERGPDEAWRTALVSRRDDRLGQPIVLLDRAAALVFATNPGSGGTVVLKRSERDRLEFETGRGQIVMTDPSDPALGFLTATKGPVDLARGFPLLAFDRKTGTYWHAILRSREAAHGSPSPTPSASVPGPSPTVSPSARTAIFTDDFDPWPDGSTITNGWAVRPQDAPATLRSVADDGSGAYAHLVSGADGQVRACKTFPAVDGAAVVASARVRFDGVGSADALITSIRDGSSESASVRAGQGGTFAYYDGATKVRTTVPVRTDRWYRSSVTVRPGAGTYDWRLTTDDGTPVLSVKSIRFREPAPQASEICLGTSAGGDGFGIGFDDVVISR
jgi:hypothetical protein